MEMSIEMKMQALDKMIEMRNQLIAMQNNLGVYNSMDEESSILVYSTEDFFEIARYVKANVSSDGIVMGNTRLVFQYKGTGFTTHVLPCEYKEYKNEIDVGEQNV